MTTLLDLPLLQGGAIRLTFVAAEEDALQVELALGDSARHAPPSRAMLTRDDIEHLKRVLPRTLPQRQHTAMRTHVVPLANNKTLGLEIHHDHLILRLEANRAVLYPSNLAQLQQVLLGQAALAEVARGDAAGRSLVAGTRSAL